MDQAKASLYTLVPLSRKKVFIQRQNVLLPSDHQPARPLAKWNIWDYHPWQQPSEKKSDNNTVHLFMLRQLTNQSIIPELSHLAASQTCLKTPPLFPLPQLLTWLASLQAGLEIISWLAPVKLSGQTYFCWETTRFWPDKCLSSRIIWLHFTVKYMWTNKNTFQHYTRSPEFAVTTLLPNFILSGSLALPDFPGLFKFRNQNGFQNRA